MSNNITLKRGLDIPIAGEAAQKIKKAVVPDVVAIKPTDFRGLLPKLLVKEGDSVLAGTPVMADKLTPGIVFSSPVSGTVQAIVRGEKRKLLEIRIKADETQKYVDFGVQKVKDMSADQIREALMKSGLWPALIQRPYGVLANPEIRPKAIFVSAFSTAPLAADVDYVLRDEFDNVQTAVNALAKLTDGGVHVSFSSVNYNGTPFHKLENVIQHTFTGRHPAGNVGIQIHHIDPIAKGDIVWTVNIQDVAAIGRLFSTGKVDLHKVIALTGSEVAKPQYYRIISGAPVASVVEGNIKPQADGGSVRIISGNVLTGKKVAADGFVTFFANQITVIPEGDKYELLGWAAPRFNKFSVSHAYFSWLCPKKQYRLDTNLNGGERPFVVTGLFEQYLPMDIYPMYLFKAIMAGDIDKMENLGIYEIIEEDVALCEFVDPSKTEIQQLVRDGINLMIKEC